MLQQGDGGNFDNDVVNADLQIRIECVYVLAHLCRSIHLDLSSQEEVWYWADRSHQAFGYRSANLCNWLIAISRCRGNRCRLVGFRLDRSWKCLHSTRSPR